MLITTQQQLDRLVARLCNETHFAFDTETTGLLPYNGDRIIGLSFGIPYQGSVDTYYVPFRHERGHLLNFPTSKLKLFAPIFADPTKTIVTWNGKFDLHMLSVDRIECRAKVLDAMCAWHLLEENLFSFSLKDVAMRKLGKTAVLDDKHLQILLKSEKMNKGDMKRLSPIEAAPYAESDALLTWLLFRMAVPRLMEEGLSGIFQEVCQYARTIERMERKGIKVDPDLTIKLIEDSVTREGELLAQLREMAGPDFNPRSSQQCQRWLGLPSTAKEYLEEMRAYPGVPELLEYRGHAKAVGSFYRPFQSRQDRFHRIHASFWVPGTVSGRLSCREPNLQQIPRTSSQWARVKNMIVAPQGYTLIEADLSQAELRMAAHHTQDPFLLQAYQEDLDIHQMVGDEVGLTRQDAKTFNFAMIYGAGVPGIMKQLGTTEERTREILRDYHARVPGVKKAYYRYRDMAENQGYVTYWSGRRRHFPFIGGQRLRTQTAFNSMLQGGVGEIMRRAMNKIDSLLPEDCYMIAQVHDSIVLEVKNKHVAEVACMVKDVLENVHQFTIPIKADVKGGKTWASLTPVKF